MARRQRFHLLGATYHVMLRGNDDQPIFFDEGDKSRLCLLIQQGVERFGHSIEAFCFMSNHIHLAIQVADISISSIMQHLSFRYTRHVNRKYKRKGHLFQGRFKSVLVDDDEYLKELIRYIHLNPVRAKLVSDPRDYSWSSHGAYLEEKDYDWLRKRRILDKFCPEQKYAVGNYEEYILRGIGIEREFDFKSGLIAGVLGEKKFVDEVLIANKMKPKQKIELPQLVAKICEMSDITPDQLCMPGKLAKHSNARSLLAFFVREIDNLSLTSLAKFLRRDPSGLTVLANRIENKSREDSLVANQVSEVRYWLRELG